MTVPREPGDPGRPGWPDDDLEVYLRSDPELAEGPSGFGRIAVYAVAALLIVGAVLYGMNQNGTTTATNPPANTAANTPNPPPIRNVTPGPNSRPGTTTGSAPATPAPAEPGARAQ
ncbi:MAG: hypothetical protein ACLP1D_09245 [Xanthobacteraceae bacterium]